MKLFKRKEKKERKRDDLDTETSFANMNVEGFSWYDPSLKSDGKRDRVEFSRKEKRAISKAYLQTFLPFIGILCAVFLLIYLLARLWLS